MHRRRKALFVLCFTLSALCGVPARDAAAFPLVVKAGDSLASIAQRVYGKVENERVLAAANGPMQGILQVTDEALVSSDLKGNDYSSIFSAMDTLVMGNMVKVVAWYDNEWGYACRVADLAAKIAKQL